MDLTFTVSGLWQLLPPVNFIQCCCFFFVVKPFRKASCPVRTHILCTAGVDNVNKELNATVWRNVMPQFVVVVRLKKGVMYSTYATEYSLQNIM